MNIYLTQLLAVSLYVAYSLTLDFQNICSCSELVNEVDCNEKQGVCSWNQNSCEEVPCLDIITQNDCVYESKRCYWSQGQCIDFTNCSLIFGTSNYQCSESNYYCPATNGTNCGPIDQLQTCSAQKNQALCNSYFSQQGLCVWYGGQCVVASSCSEFFDSFSHLCSFGGCYSTGGVCLPITCSYLQTEILCEAGTQIFGSYLQNIVACQWNLNSQTCEDFNPSTVDQSQCLQNSFGTYCWSDTKKQCQQCQDRLLEIIFVVLISLIQ